MTTLTEIETAAKRLSRQEQEILLRHLVEHLYPNESSAPVARIVRGNSDTFLEATPDAPPMTPEHVRSLLENWP